MADADVNNLLYIPNEPQIIRREASFSSSGLCGSGSRNRTLLSAAVPGLCITLADVREDT